MTKKGLIIDAHSPDCFGRRHNHQKICKDRNGVKLSAVATLVGHMVRGQVVLNSCGSSLLHSIRHGDNLWTGPVRYTPSSEEGEDETHKQRCHGELFWLGKAQKGHQ